VKPWQGRQWTQVMAGSFFLAMIASSLWVAPATYRYARQGYPDFSCFYAAGKMVLEGHGRSLYDLAAQSEVQRQFSQVAMERNRALYYMRPPFEAVLFSLFARLDYAKAYVTWVGLNLILIAAAAAFVRRAFSQLMSIPGWVYYAAYFAFAPIVYGLTLGQDTGIVLLLFALVAVCLATQREFGAGCALGFTLIKFQLALPFVTILLLKRRFRTLAGFSLVSTILVAVSASIVGIRGLIEYPAYLFRLNQLQTTAAISPAYMPNIRGLLEGWAGLARLRPTLDLLTAVLSLMLLVWVARRWNISAAGSQAYLGGLTLALLAAVLSGYQTFVHDLSLLCPVLLISASVALDDSRLDLCTRRLLAAAAGLLFAPLYFVAMHFMGRLNVMGIFLLLLVAGWSRAISRWEATPLRESDLKSAGCAAEST